jgi:fatty acid desaturase
MTARAAQFRDLYIKLRIEEQLRWYQSRRDEYKKANGQAIVVRTVLLALAALAGLAAPLATTTGRAALGVAAALLAALAAAVTAFAALIGFTQVGKLYDDAASSLEAAEDDWNELGPDDDLAAALGTVEQIFRTENGQWGQLVIQGTPPDPAPGTGTASP